MYIQVALGTWNKCSCFTAIAIELDESMDVAYHYPYYLNSIKCLYICIYICNELIEETAGHRTLIFGMWESFGYGSSKF